MYFYPFLVGRALIRRQNGLMALHANGWEQVAKKGSHILLSASRGSSALKLLL
jgi:predicted RNA binding protein YcfA (HicA-like mRNA interferase family)